MLRFSYHGAAFRGFAPNAGVATVGGTLQAALETVFQHEVPITCAGRTDAGVHAHDQVVHFDTERPVDLDRLGRSINGLCKPHIAIHSVEQVGQEFDARFSCIERRYRYRVLNRSVPCPFRHDRTWRVHGALDLDAMNAAGAHLLGTHDFASFCRRQIVDIADGQHEKSRVRELRELTWTRQPDDEIQLVIVGSSFCQQMVRSIAGMCVDVGLGRVQTSEVPAILASKDRTSVPRVAPPQGLSLERVRYN